MRFQKIILYGLLATLAVGCDRYGGFSGCWGCDGFWGCDQWELSDDHFTRHESALPFSMYFSVSGAGDFNVYGPSANGTTNSDALASIGIQHFITNNWAFRVLAIFGRFSNGASVDSLERTNTSYGIGVGALHYFRPLYNIAPYAGLGLGYRTGTIQDPQIPFRAGGGQNPQQVTNEATYNAFGVTAVAGFDWYLTPNIAVGSEYAFGFSSIGGTQTVNGTESDLPTQTKLGFTPSGNVHLLIHF